MANPYLILWFDPTLNRLYTGWGQNTPANTPILKQGDNIGVELHWIKSGSANFPMQEVSFPPSADITLAVGRLDAEPTSGTFTVTYGANTTPELDYDITAAELQTALNALASITAEGGVAVNKIGSNFRIVWNDPVVTANTLTADVNNLSPTSDSQVVVSKVGSATNRQVVLFSLKQAPMAACSSFTPSPEPAITVTSIFANTWRVSIEPSPRTGTFTISQLVGTTTTSTDPIPFSASGSQVEQELDAILDGYFVLKSGEFSWDITAPSSVVSLSASSALVGYSSMYGVLSMNTAEVEEFLAGEDSATATLEVQADIAGEIQTLIQTPVTVINDLISTSIFNLVELPEVMPVDSVVRYDTPQTLTSGEQLTARTNIGAAASTEIAALVAEDIVLDGRISAVETAVGDIDQSLSTTSDVTFKSVSVTFVDPLNPNKAFSYYPAGDGYKFAVTSVGNLFGEWIDGGVQLGYWSLNNEEGFNITENTSGTTSIHPNGISMSSPTATITFPDSTQQATAFIPANYLTATAIGLDYLSKAGNLSGLVNTATARSNLGLGSMATQTATDYLAVINNLSDLQDAATARANLALGENDSPTFAGLTVTSGVTTTSITPSEITFADATTQGTRVVREHQANGGGFSTGGFDTAHYPYEVKVVAADGSEYWVPARPA